MMRAPAGTTTTASNLTSSLPVPPRVGESDRVLHAMTSVLARQRPTSAAEALQVLRRGYPEIPLAMRIAALCAGGR
jgi:hypothetical protein